ncbi:hypothetical protein [Epinotia aporema granulovirus]|uniref:Chitin-binding type-2 domain-containing protein n=1 Tax=Epinotia aporema granulovirus TaxID=166056 RepID=K4ER64_9BBAC|nr:hypothetical protein [Epinotia aporema granulovirus]AER41499.1 hypothetical protein [Epinotia aporema granulovirus]
MSVALFFFILYSMIAIVFLLQQSTTPPLEDIDDGPPDVADENDCRKYYNRFGWHMQCPVYSRFDDNARKCRNQFLVDCGNRFNVMDSIEEICATQNEKSNFPVLDCREWAYCDSTDIFIQKCNPDATGVTHYDIESRVCMSQHEVDCGSRIN